MFIQKQERRSDRIGAPYLANILRRGLSSCSPPAPECLAAASSTPRYIPAPYHPRLPPPSESIYPYESEIGPSLRLAAAPGACHLSAVSGRPLSRPAARIPGKAFPGSSCSARRCPEFRPSRTSIPFPASHRPSSPSAAAFLFDNTRVPSRRTRPQTSGRPPAHKTSCACGRSPFSSNIRDLNSPENSTPLLLCAILKALPCSFLRPVLTGTRFGHHQAPVRPKPCVQLVRVAN